MGRNDRAVIGLLLNASLPPQGLLQMNQLDLHSAEETVPSVPRRG